MSELIAVMPYSHYEGACNAIREATGKTDKIPSGEFETELRNALASGGADNSIVGTWVFNDEITTALDVVDTQEKYEAYLENSSPHQLKGFTPDYEITAEFGCWQFVGAFEEMSDCINLYEANDYFAYDSRYGWDIRPSYITITEEPSDEVAAWIRANATKQPNGIAYRVSSIDDLPSDAVDGSMAIVDSDSIIGTWEFNETLNFDVLNLPSNANKFVWCASYENVTDTFGSFRFVVRDGAIELYFGTTLAYVSDGDYWDDAYGAVTIYTDVSDYSEVPESDFKTWLNQNATRVSGGYAFYIRENGEWVYRGNST